MASTRFLDVAINGRYFLVLDGMLIHLYEKRNEDFVLMKAFERKTVYAQILPHCSRIYILTMDQQGELFILFNEMDDWKEIGIGSVDKTASMLRACRCPPNMRFGCIIKGVVHVYELIIDERPHFLPLRRYMSHQQIVSFDFTCNETVWCATAKEIIKYSANKNTSLFLKNLSSDSMIKVIKASPVSPDTVSILFEDSSISIFNESQILNKISTVQNVKDMQWSPLGDALCIEGDRIEIVEEITHNVWKSIE